MRLIASPSSAARSSHNNTAAANAAMPMSDRRDENLDAVRISEDDEGADRPKRDPLVTVEPLHRLRLHLDTLGARQQLGSPNIMYPANATIVCAGRL